MVILCYQKHRYYIFTKYIFHNINFKKNIFNTFIYLLIYLLLLFTFVYPTRIQDCMFISKQVQIFWSNVHFLYFSGTWHFESSCILLNIRFRRLFNPPTFIRKQILPQIIYRLVGIRLRPAEYKFEYNSRALSYALI